MGLGVVTGSLSIVRTVLNWQNETDDPTWSSIPNWYWRSWEVFFGIAAACIPTVRPGYKWLIGKIRTKFTRISSNEPTKPTVGPSAEKWTPPKPSSGPSKKSKEVWSDSLISTTKTAPEEDILPLQNFDPSFRASMENYPRGDQDSGEEKVQDGRYPTNDDGTERRAGLHLPGDLSTNRPGHFKRLDSEAKVGGGHGFEEVEDRI